MARPEQQERATVTYVSAIRAHPGLILLITLAAVAASVVFLAVRSSDYEATTKLLVQPIPAEDQTFLGLPLIRDTGDPVRTMQTAASLVESPPAAALVAKQRGDDSTTNEILDQIKISPEGQSNILAVTATADSAAGAAKLSDQFSRAVLEVRSGEIAQAAGGLVGQLRAALRATPRTDPSTRADLGARLDQLNSVVSQGDPTLQLSQPAIPPTSAKGASSGLIVLLALLAGFALGSGTALLVELTARSGQRDR
jgi:uncharacterized protein involved in exopolysaccharide biosynthesis